MRLQLLARHMVMVLALVLLGGFLGSVMVRLAPGFGVDERELDPRLRKESVQALREARGVDRGLFGSYFAYLHNAVRGDLGTSQSLRRPVSQLLAERIPVTARTVALGLLIGWLLGISLALPGLLHRAWTYDLFTTGATGLLLCLPSAVVALLLLFANVTRSPAAWAVALVVFPKVFRYSRNILMETCGQPHVLMAMAKGLGRSRIIGWHVLSVAAPQLLALAGVSVSMALSAAVPIEVISDSPGIGQLAWHAAMGRDLPLLVNLTILVSMVTLIANAASDLTIHATRPRAS